MILFLKVSSLHDWIQLKVQGISTNKSSVSRGWGKISGFCLEACWILDEVIKHL